MSFGVHPALKRERRSGVVCGESLAVQSDKERTDIRYIVKRAMRGASVNVNVREGRYADVSDAPSYMEALNVVARANELFAGLPSKVRDRFGNDPVKMLAFLDDKENIEEARKLGLVPPEAPAPKPPEPMLVKVVADDVPKS